MIYALRRLASALATLLLLSVLTFVLVRVAPGGPFDTDHAWPADIKANIEHQYELDRPVTTQYLHWLRDVLHGDFRESFQYMGRPVSEMIGEALPPSILLGGLSLLLSVGIGIPLGCLAAWKRDSWMDLFSMILSVAGISLPSYLIASLLILYFSLYLKWLPPALWESPSSIILPTLTLACRPIALVARLTRSSMLDALHADYVRTAQSKGLSSARVVFKHALKNSLIPVVTVLGPIAASLVTGSFVVELVFQIPGLGKHFVQAVLNRDYPLVMGVTLVYGAVLIGCNLAVDLLYGWIDPRIRILEER